MRKLSINFPMTSVIFLSLSLLFHFNLAFEIKSATVNPPNGVEVGGKVRLSCQLMPGNVLLHP